MAFIPDETPWNGGQISENIYCLRADNPSPMSYVGTNIYFVSADGFPGADAAEKPEALLIDPAPSGATVDQIIDKANELGIEIAAVALTHSHHDHSEGACELIVKLAALQGKSIDQIPLFSRSFTLEEAQQVAENAGVTLPEGSDQISFEYLEEGDFLVFENETALEVALIPGHSADSIAFIHEDDNVMFIGDTAFRHGPTVVYHPDGVLKDYMESLETMDAIAKDNPGMMFAAGHGTLIDDPIGCIDATRGHRNDRLEQIKAALAKGVPAEAGPLVDDVYVGIDPRLRPASLASVEAQLLYLGY